MDFHEAYDPFRALQSAWGLLKRAPLTLLVGGILILLTEGESSGGGEWGWKDGSMSDEQVAILLPVIFACCLVGLALWLFSCLVQVGFATAVERVAATGEERFKDLFQSRGRWLPYLLTRLLVIVVSFLAVVPGVLMAVGGFVLGRGLGGPEAGALLAGLTFLLVGLPPLIYVGLGVALAPKAAAIERLWPVDAIQRSWSLARGNRLWLFWYVLIANVVLGFIGLCCGLCIGYFFTRPLTLIADNEAYLRLVRADQDGWWLSGGAGAAFEPEPDALGGTSW